jgi:hypothetical protein
VEPLTRGLLPPDPRSLCPLSATDWVDIPPPPKKKNLGYATGINNCAWYSVTTLIFCVVHILLSLIYGHCFNGVKFKNKKIKVLFIFGVAVLWTVHCNKLYHHLPVWIIICPTYLLCTTFHITILTSYIVHRMKKYIYNSQKSIVYEFGIIKTKR